MPAVVTFTFSLGDTSYGMVSFDYADAQVDPELASQQLSVNDTQILIDGQSVVVEEVWSAPVASFSQGQLLGGTFAYDVVAGNSIQRDMADFDAQIAIYKDFRVKQQFAPTPAAREAARLMANEARSKLLGYSTSIATTYDLYRTRYFTVLAQHNLLWGTEAGSPGILPLEQQLLLNPVPPALEVPGEYFEPFDNLV